jgi:ABC-type bacteriocin/lantibiotic exporter with double-glycine peptidase domain
LSQGNRTFGHKAGSTMAARSRGVRLETGNFKQSRAMCGPACLKIVLAYFGKRASETLIAKACRASRLTGTSGSNLVKGAKRFGFRAELMDHADLRTIEKWLRRGVPVIVDWMSTVAARGTSTACGHYSVVCGVDKHHILLQDPGIGRRRRLSRRTFLNVWFDFKRVFPKAQDDLIIRRLIIVAPQEFSNHHPRQRRSRKSAPAVLLPNTRPPGVASL